MEVFEFLNKLFMGLFIIKIIKTIKVSYIDIYCKFIHLCYWMHLPQGSLVG